MTHLICFFVGMGIGYSLCKFSKTFGIKCTQIAGDHSVQCMDVSLDGDNITSCATQINNNDINRCPICTSNNVSIKIDTIGDSVYNEIKCKDCGFSIPFPGDSKLSNDDNLKMIVHTWNNCNKR